MNNILDSTHPMFSLPDPEVVWLSMSGPDNAVARASKITWERRSVLRQICLLSGFRWDNVNAFIGPAWHINTLIEALNEALFQIKMESSVVFTMEKIAEAGRKKVEWLDTHIQAMEQASEGQLRPFQSEDAYWMAHAGSGVLAYEQRIGKTVLALTQVRKGAVIICPLAAVELVWGWHVRKWLPWKRFTPLQAFRWPQEDEVVCLNFERLKDALCEAPEGVTIIVDEAHAARNPATTRTRRSRAIVSAALRKDGRAWALTGTPAPNGRPKELWALLELVQAGKKTFGDLKSFSREMELDWDNAGAKGRMASVVLRRLRSQVASHIPPATWRDWDIPLDQLESWAQEAMNRLWDMAVARGLNVGDPAELVRALHRDPEFHEISRIRSALATAKIPLAEKWAEEMEEAGEPCVVVSAHRAPVLALGNRPGWGYVMGGDTQRQKTVEAFQAGHLKGIALTVGAGGVAINLDRADNLLFMDRDWVPGNNAQAADRIISTSKTQVKSFVRMLVDHPLERRVEEVLSGKISVITRAIDTLAAGGGETEGARAQAIIDMAAKPHIPKEVDLGAMGSFIANLPAIPKF